MSIIETAKELLKKGIALNDKDLIDMANTLLSDATPPVSVSIAGALEDPPQEHKDTIMEQFEVKHKNTIDRKSSIPVTNRLRENTFIDNLDEHKDVKTPEAPLTERKRAPAKNVEQTCESCKETFNVAPAHARDFYTCDGCLANKTKGR